MRTYFENAHDEFHQVPEGLENLFEYVRDAEKVSHDELEDGKIYALRSKHLSTEYLHFFLHNEGELEMKNEFDLTESEAELGNRYSDPHPKIWKSNDDYNFTCSVDEVIGEAAEDTTWSNHEEKEFLEMPSASNPLN